MDVERIEAALREGPPDEPAYVPNSFRGAGPSGWRMAMAALTVGVVLVAGIAIGSGLGLLRGNLGDAPAPRVLTVADLQGVWQADPIAFDAWTEALLARGFSQADLDAFLEHDPFEDQVRYQLRFIGDRFVVQATYDEDPIQTLGSGTFTLNGDGVIHLAEVVGGGETGCEFTVAAEIDRSRLQMDVLDLSSCDTDEQMANTLFFDVAPYVRAED